MPNVELMFGDRWRPPGMRGREAIRQNAGLKRCALCGRAFNPMAYAACRTGFYLCSLRHLKLRDCGSGRYADAAPRFWVCAPARGILCGMRCGSCRYAISAPRLLDLRCRAVHSAVERSLSRDALWFKSGAGGSGWIKVFSSIESTRTFRMMAGLKH